MERQYPSQIQDYLRLAASRARDTQRIGPFLATFTTHDANHFLNYAIPDAGANPDVSAVYALIAAFHQRERTPRLEYLPDVAPAVQSVCVEAGFSVEDHMPLMVCPLFGLHAISVPAGITLLYPKSDAEIFDLISAQNEAYGESPPQPEAVARRQEFLDAGGIAILARDQLTGAGVGGGMCDVPWMLTTELTSVGVRAAYRRRGIAAALTAHLAQAAFDAGVTTVFLMAAHEAEARMYARVGFIRIGEVLGLTLPVA